MVKRGKMSRRVSSSFSGDGIFSESQKEGRQNVIKLIVSLTVLVLLVGSLIYFSPGQFVGKAINVGGVEGSYVLKPYTAPYNDCGNSDYFSTDILDGRGVMYRANEGCCPKNNEDYCVGNFRPADGNTFERGIYCYSLNSVVYDSNRFFCGESSNRDQSEIDDVVGAWFDCDNEAEGDIRGSYICINGAWVNLPPPADVSPLPPLVVSLPSQEIADVSPLPSLVVSLPSPSPPSQGIVDILIPSSPSPPSQEIVDILLTSCSLEEKYETRRILEREIGEELCNGAEWITCSQFRTNPIIDPNVEISCGRFEIAANVFAIEFLVKELVCNNDLDDDNDGLLDCEDSDCLDVRSFTMDNAGSFEVTLKNTDCEESAINLLIPIPAINLPINFPRP